MKDVFLKLKFSVLKIYMNFKIMPERMKTEKIERVAANLHDKKESIIHMKIYKKFKTSIKL